MFLNIERHSITTNLKYINDPRVTYDFQKLFLLLKVPEINTFSRIKTKFHLMPAIFGKISE